MNLFGFLVIVYLVECLLECRLCVMKTLVFSGMATVIGSVATVVNTSTSVLWVFLLSVCF